MPVVRARFCVEPLPPWCYQRREVQSGLVLSVVWVLGAGRLPLLMLQVRQMTMRLFWSCVPPFDHGVMWSGHAPFGVRRFW